MLPNDIKILIEETTNDKIDSLLGDHLTLKSGKILFIKRNNKNDSSLLNEANGLQELSKSGHIKCPKVYFVNQEILITDFISVYPNNPKSEDVLGLSLAKLHKINQEYFGFYEDNFIGLGIQKNKVSDKNISWKDFFYEYRILPQFELAHNKYHSSELKSGIKKLEKNLDIIIKSTEESPSLLHGDLWAGNFLTDKNNEPVLIDPAVYYGHREIELAMTTLFGGFSSHFYESYEKEYPLKDGFYGYREKVYQLYHLLNHLNIFGTSYLPDCLRILKNLF